MEWWQAALIVLYDAGPSFENIEQGQWTHVDGVCGEIESRKLKNHRSDRPSQTVGEAMRNQGHAYIQNKYGKTGLYRIANRKQTVDYLNSHYLWDYTETAREAKKAKEAKEAEARTLAAAARKRRPTNRSNTASGSTPMIKKPVSHLIPEENCIEGGRDADLGQHL